MKKNKQIKYESPSGKSYVKGFTKKGEVFLFDKDDLELVIKYNWYVSKRGYVVTPIKRVATPMHKIILNAPKGYDIDHISGNKLDNRKSNLRICTHQENMFNQKRRCTNTTGYIGVSKVKRIDRFEAYIHMNGKKHYLGLYDTAKEAAIARDQAAKKLFGEYARLNFKGEAI